MRKFVVKSYHPDYTVQNEKFFELEDSRTLIVCNLPRGTTESDRLQTHDDLEKMYYAHVVTGICISVSEVI